MKHAAIFLRHRSRFILKLDVAMIEANGEMERFGGLSKIIGEGRKKNAGSAGYGMIEDQFARMQGKASNGAVMGNFRGRIEVVAE